jgi:hypothetical protein
MRDFCYLHGMLERRGGDNRDIVAKKTGIQRLASRPRSHNDFAALIAMGSAGADTLVASHLLHQSGDAEVEVISH